MYHGLLEPRPTPAERATRAAPNGAVRAAVSKSEAMMPFGFYAFGILRGHENRVAGTWPYGDLRMTACGVGVRRAWRMILWRPRELFKRIRRNANEFDIRFGVACRYDKTHFQCCRRSSPRILVQKFRGGRFWRCRRSRPSRWAEWARRRSVRRRRRRFPSGLSCIRCAKD